MERFLAIIEPTEDHQNKDECKSRIYFLTGRLKGKTWNRILGTDIFTYYFYGATIEVVSIESSMIIDVKDPKREDIKEFDIGISYALTLNNSTKEILSTNGFVYKLEQSTFYRRFPNVVCSMYNTMWNGQPFVWQLYTINGAIVYIKMITGIKYDSPMAKYCLGGGFVAQDKDILKYMLPKTDTDFKDSKEKLSQEEIDDMFDKYRREL